MSVKLLVDVLNAYHVRWPDEIERLILRHLSRCESLPQALANGDDAHRAWLEKAIADHLAGRPVQPRDSAQ